MYSAIFLVRYFRWRWQFRLGNWGSRIWEAISIWAEGTKSFSISQPFGLVIIQQLKYQPSSRAICIFASDLDDGDSCDGAITFATRKSTKGKVPSFPPLCSRCGIFDQTSKALTCAVTSWISMWRIRGEGMNGIQLTENLLSSVWFWKDFLVTREFNSFTFKPSKTLFFHSFLAAVGEQPGGVLTLSLFPGPELS